MKQYDINGKTIKFKVHMFEGKQSIEYYENQIISALSNIGVYKDYITIEYDDVNVLVHWIINGKNFVFRCESQETSTLNLGAVSQAIQEDIRQVTRGIKDLYTIMNQYEDKNFKPKKKKNIFDFDSGSSKPIEESSLFSTESLVYSNPVKGELKEEYKYFLNFNTDQLDRIYFKFKQECFNNRDPEHPRLIALKLVRQYRGLKL